MCYRIAAEMDENETNGEGQQTKANNKKCVIM